MEEKILAKSEKGKGWVHYIFYGVAAAWFALGLLRFFEDIRSFPSNAYYCLLLGVVISLPIFIVGLVIHRMLSNSELVVTNKRVYGKAAFGKRVDLPCDMISAVGLGAFKRVAVSTASGKISFYQIKNRDEMFETISAILRRRQRNLDNSENNSEKQKSADELIQLQDLLDRGILTQEEFDAKKKKILDI